MKTIYLEIKEQNRQQLLSRLVKVINWMQLRYDAYFLDIKYGYFNDQFLGKTITVKIRLKFQFNEK